MMQITGIRDVIFTGQGTSSESSGPQFLKPFEKSAIFTWVFSGGGCLSIETKISNPPYNKQFREKETSQGEYTKEAQKDYHRRN